MDGGRKLRTARGQDLSLSSVSGGQRKKRSQDPDPGSQMQDHSSDQQQGRIQERKWPGSVTQLRVRLAEEVEEPGLRNEMDRSPTQAGGCSHHLFDPLPLSSAKFAYKRRSGQDLSLSSVSGWQRKLRSQD